MKKTKFDGLMLCFSLVFSVAGEVFCIVLYDQFLLFEESMAGLLLWSALFFTIPFLCGLIGVCITEHIRKKQFTIRRKGKRRWSFLSAVMIGILLGAGGQFLYMATVQENWEQPETETIISSPDLVFLVDGSSSMSGREASCSEAAEQVIDQLEEECYVQAVAFAGDVIDSTGLLAMDQEGKKKIIDFIGQMDTEGGTEFNAALGKAFDTLDGSTTGNLKKAVILLTDGKGDLSEETKRTYLNTDIQVYSIRITGDEPIEDQEKKLISFVEQTGGFDTEIPLNTQDDISVDKLSEALEEAVQNTLDPVLTKQLAFEEQRIAFGAQDIGAWRFGVRMLVFALYGILATWVYYYSVSLKSIVVNICMGIVMSAAAMAFPDIISMALYCLIFWTAFTKYQYAKGVEAGV